VLQLYGPGVNESKTKGEFLALGDSREPPAATIFGRMERWNKIREVVRQHAKAAPLQALATNMSFQRTNRSRATTD
jgi:hypothetical protein